MKLRSLAVVAVLAAVIAAIYFGNVEFQSLLGRRAVARTGLAGRTFEAALAEAKANGKLVLVDVAAIWCPTCRRLDNDVFSKPEVRASINARFVFARLEYESDEGREFLEKYSASGFPTLFVIAPDGRVVEKLPVTFDPDAFVAELGRAAAKEGK